MTTTDSSHWHKLHEVITNLFDSSLNKLPRLEITPEIPEIASKNTIIPAVTIYLPENLAGRNYWLLFITYLLVRWKIFDTFNRKLRKTIIRQYFDSCMGPRTPF